MCDPVILSSGHTFDRNSIQRLISNYAPTPPRHPHRYRYSEPETDSLSQLGPLIATLTSRTSSDVEKLESITRIGSISRAHPGDSGPGHRLGGLSAVLGCVGPGTDPVLQEKCLTLLLNLSLDSDDNKVGLVAEGAVERLTAALVGPAAATAATVITSLAVWRSIRPPLEPTQEQSAALTLMAAETG
ncbi:U-box domain-containing protein 8 [Bienertia sinuspersici]